MKAPVWNSRPGCQHCGRKLKSSVSRYQGECGPCHYEGMQRQYLSPGRFADWVKEKIAKIKAQGADHED